MSKLSRTERARASAPSRRKAPERASSIDPSVFDLLVETRTLIRAGLVELGLDEFIIAEGFRIDGFSRTDRTRGGNGYECTLNVRPGLGVIQPLSSRVRTGGDEPDDAAGLAEHYLAEIAWIHDHRIELAAARAALSRAVAEVVRDATSEGLAIDLLSIELVRYDPFYPRKDYLGSRFHCFDVEMLMLGDDNGPIGLDRYTMDACEADEFASYLRRRILPEQRALATRQGTGQDV